jgi:hypothetical protein
MRNIKNSRHNSAYKYSHVIKRTILEKYMAADEHLNVSKHFYRKQTASQFISGQKRSLLKIFIHFYFFSGAIKVDNGKL